jgi:SAM-dependent MidA family methyltransferase
LIDYGYEASELYSPHRRQGTLLCYAGHAVSSDPLARPGLQDITTHVDWTAVRRTILEAGLDVAWQKSQRDALMDAGLGAWLSETQRSRSPWTERLTALRSLQALADADGLGNITWLAATQGFQAGAMVPAPPPASLALGDHLHLPDPATLDPIPDVEAQWRELWDDADGDEGR